MNKRSVVVVLNGISLQKKHFYKRILPALEAVAAVEVKETLTKNDAVALASKAADHHADVVFAAGGDGTLNQVLNGILCGREKASKLPVIGLIPLGSGNDFARTANVVCDGLTIQNLLSNYSPKMIDVGVIDHKLLSGEDSRRYFVNMADIGMGPIVVQKVLNSGRPFGHAIAYYKSILSTFFQYKLVEVEARGNDWMWHGKLRTLGVGNGQYYGHGLAITPDAVLDDRLFHVFICGKVSVFDFIRFTGHLKNRKHIPLTEVHYKTATQVQLKSRDLCLIEGDGEVLGKLPATITLLERQVPFLI